MRSWWLVAALTLPVPALAVDVDGGPFVRGQTTQIQITGAAPNEDFRLLWGDAAGSGPCPPVLQGACVGIASPRVWRRGTTDGAGEATVDITVPAAAPLTDLVLQVVLTAPSPDLSAVVPSAVVDVLGPGPDLFVTTQAGWERLRHHHQLQRRVVVEGLPLDVLELPWLESFTEELVFRSNDATEIVFPRWTQGANARCETASLRLETNLALELLDAPSVTQTSICSEGNGPLVAQLPNLLDARVLSFTSYNRIPVPPDDLLDLVAPSLVSVGDLEVYYARATFVSLPALVTAGTMQIWHNQLLVDLDFPALDVGGVAAVVDNPTLSTCEVDEVFLGMSLPPVVNCNANDYDAACTAMGCTP